MSLAARCCLVALSAPVEQRHESGAGTAGCRETTLEAGAPPAARARSYTAFARDRYKLTHLVSWPRSTVVLHSLVVGQIRAIAAINEGPRSRIGGQTRRAQLRTLYICPQFGR
jgi:hypothetical protein